MFLSLNFIYLSASFKEMPCTLTITDPKLLHGKCFKLWNILSSNKSPERGIPHQVSSDRLQSNWGVLSLCTYCVLCIIHTDYQSASHLYLSLISKTSYYRHKCFKIWNFWSQAFLFLCCFWDFSLTQPKLVPSISVFMLLFLRQSSHYIAQAGFEPVIIIPQSHKQWEHRHIQPCSITLKCFWQRKLNLYLQFLFTSSSSPIPNFLRMPHYTFIDTSNSTRIKNKNKTVVKILTYTQIIKSQESIILPTPTPMFLLNSSVISI